MLVTDSPAEAGRYMKRRFQRGAGAEVQTTDDILFWFIPHAIFDGSGSLLVCCSVGGAVKFDDPVQVNRWACIRKRFPMRAAVFAEQSVREMVVHPGEKEVVLRGRKRMRPLGAETKRIGS